MSNRIVLGCVADDYTGATDFSAMITRVNARVVQFFGVPGEPLLASPAVQSAVDSATAIVVALKTRSAPREIAIEDSLAALDALRKLGASRFYFKYCSTFDSTASGNIGPVAEAMAARLKQSVVWYCPALPENGRTVYCGHLFVHGVPLHESGMKDHPLTPMRDSNLIRVLQPQVTWPIKLLNHNRLAKIQEVGFDTEPYHVIVDAIDDGDLRRIATLASDHVLMSGSSGISGYWASTLGIATSIGDIDREAQTFVTGQKMPSAEQHPFTVILAGSCSNATRSQMTVFEQAGGPTLHLNAMVATADRPSFDAEVERVVNWCLQHKQLPAVLVESGRDAQVVCDLAQHLGPAQAAAAVEEIFASIAAKLAHHGVCHWIVAGGETSGAVIRALDVKAVSIGPEIDAGVPWVQSLDEAGYWLALKSGNFGQPSFFADALKCFENHATRKEPCDE
jgi:3-dehydrotetronate 4-kinase